MPVVDDVLIRPATADDAPAVARMWERLVAHHRQLDPDLPDAAPQGGALYARSLAERVDDTHTCIYVADADGEIIGYVLGVIVDLLPKMFEYEPSGFLADIYVEQEYRRLGVGKALVDALVDWFADHGLRHYEWHVAARNMDGVAFWQSLGGRDVLIRMRAEIPLRPNDDEAQRE